MKKLVIDIDGVVWDIFEVVEKRLWSEGYTKFDVSRSLTYDVNKSLSTDKLPEYLIKTTDNHYPYYLNAPRDRIYELFNDPKIFQDAILHKDVLYGLKKVCMEESLEVVFATQSFNKEVAKVKKNRINTLLKGYNHQYVEFIGKTKGIIEDADIVIEDSIDNLDMYGKGEKYVMKLLINKSYNSEKYNTSVNNFKDIIRCPNTCEALNYALLDVGAMPMIISQVKVRKTNKQTTHN